MIMTNKLLPVALVAALLGGSVGAYVMHSKKQLLNPKAQSQLHNPLTRSMLSCRATLPPEINSFLLDLILPRNRLHTNQDLPTASVLVSRARPECALRI